MVLREIDPERGKGAYKTRVAVAYAENAETANKLAEGLIEPGSIIMTDESGAYSALSVFYDHQVVAHSHEFSTIDGVNENQAECYFSRLRRAEYGTYHGFRPDYLLDYAQEFAWREDFRRRTELDKLQDLARRLFDAGMSCLWRGYWEGHKRPKSWIERPLLGL